MGRKWKFGQGTLWWMFKQIPSVFNSALKKINEDKWWPKTWETDTTETTTEEKKL